MKSNDNTEKKRDIMQMKNICITAGIICIVTFIIGSFFTDIFPLAFGLIGGYIISLLSFRLLYLDCQKIVKMTEASANKLGSSGYFKRLLIKGAALFVAISRDDMSLLGCFIGILSINIAIYALNFIQIILIKEKKR